MSECSGQVGLFRHYQAAETEMVGYLQQSNEASRASNLFRWHGDVSVSKRRHYPAPELLHYKRVDVPQRLTKSRHAMRR